jgi:hypothetical protein
MRIVDASICYADRSIRRIFAEVLSITMPDGDITKCYRHDPPPDYILTSRCVPQHVGRTHSPVPFLEEPALQMATRGLAISHDKKV